MLLLLLYIYIYMYIYMTLCLGLGFQEVWSLGDSVCIYSRMLLAVHLWLVRWAGTCHYKCKERDPSKDIKQYSWMWVEVHHWFGIESLSLSLALSPYLSFSALFLFLSLSISIYVYIWREIERFYVGFVLYNTYTIYTCYAHVMYIYIYIYIIKAMCWMANAA